MRRWHASLVGILLLALVPLGGCTGGGLERAGSTIRLTARASGRTIPARIDDEVVVTLESNASTGFRWIIHTAPDAAVVEILGSRYVAPTDTALGAAGMEIWRFHVTGTGSTTVELAYERSSGERAGQPFRLTIRVSAAE